MTSQVAEKQVVVRADPDALARAVASRLLSRVSKRVVEGKLAHVSLTGGSMAGQVLAAVAAHPRRAEIDWSLVHFWWSDERFVPRGSADRNDAVAAATLFDLIDIPADHIHAMAASDDGLDLDAAADAYAAELARFADPAVGAWPSFDVCFLGVGPDAHIASLFPDRPEISITDRAAVPVRESPKPPAERITMTRPVINSSKRVWMVLVGPDKASALGLALAGASYQSVPAAGAKGRKRTVFFVDEAAAGKVPPELIDIDY
ncbi:6-phosphogluconolactonase [Microbacterium sp. cx-55]|uniref:6-phosphogluconolactonase n=1 Tax=unclassified Microbacterium TaxID=2609290 RepID=UPI001CBE6D13|nr:MULTISPECIES: 6-phosphogluconolactonase [unclassified Microbacterium]MBZ4486511.1 6-phosphogluconolactonase [Microbacterium sp. cx-55]MCC4907484.1 6-phosphogluconolactonase [Microbacterium sp. cx-59]UGB36521.1 6-phosphogluconolactonase [Microbacterium sp. cx-55]